MNSQQPGAQNVIFVGNWRLEQCKQEITATAVIRAKHGGKYRWPMKACTRVSYINYFQYINIKFTEI